MSSDSTYQNPSDSDCLLSTKEAAEFLGVSAAFLERDRWAGARTGHGPLIPYIKVTPRAVRYRLADLREHITTRRMSRAEDIREEL